MLCSLVRNSPKNSKKKHVPFLRAAINAKVAQIKEQLEAENAEKFAEEVAAAKESLAERVDSYLEYVLTSGLKRTHSQLKLV